MYYENILKSVQAWFPGFFAVYHYTRFDMASEKDGDGVAGADGVRTGNTIAIKHLGWGWTAGSGKPRDVKKILVVRLRI